MLRVRHRIKDNDPRLLAMTATIKARYFLYDPTWWDDPYLGQTRTIIAAKNALRCLDAAKVVNG